MNSFDIEYYISTLKAFERKYARNIPHTYIQVYMNGTVQRIQRFSGTLLKPVYRSTSRLSLCFCGNGKFNIVIT